MFGLFRRKTLLDALMETKKVYIEGVKFEIKKINPLDYLDGSKIMLKLYDTYKPGNSSKEAEASQKKIEAHMKDVFMAAVVEPKLCRKPNEDGILVDCLLNDWAIANKLYESIYTYTYGKKKLKLNTYQGQSLRS